MKILAAFFPFFNPPPPRRRATSDRIAIENRLTRVEVLLVLDIALGFIKGGL